MHGEVSYVWIMALFVLYWAISVLHFMDIHPLIGPRSSTAAWFPRSYAISRGVHSPGTQGTSRLLGHRCQVQRRILVSIQDHATLLTAEHAIRQRQVLMVPTTRRA